MVSNRDFLECLRLKAGALYEWAKATQKDREERLSKSIETYHLLIQLLEEQRTKYVSSRYRQLIGAKALSVYEKAISACYYAIATGLDSAKYTRLAFQIVEKNKNRQLRDALRVHETIEFADIPQSVLDKENALKRKLKYSNRMLFQQKQQPESTKDITKTQALQEEVFNLNRQWEQFDQQLSMEYPAYHQLKNGEPAMDLKVLQSKLEGKTLLMEYFYGDEEAYVFAITNTGVFFEKLLPVPSLNHLLSKCLETARNPEPGKEPPETLYADLHSLFNGLLPERVVIPADVSKIVVVPDGPLGYLPFEMLVTSISGSPRFLVEDFDVHYAYSSYLVNKKPQHKKANSKYVGFAPSYPQNNLNTVVVRDQVPGVLTHNKAEVRSAQSYFSGLAFLDSAGTEQNFKQHGKSAGILHFSMHAWINDEFPELSRLIFYQPEQPSATSETDGSLYLYELYNETLQAQLTVLSACNTGYGQWGRGEGIISLGRAFRYAGCSSIVMSLWETNDKHSQYLIDRFFFHLKNGLGKDEALRQAKLDFLQEPSHKYFKHPYYWASLILIGEPSELSQQCNNRLVVIVMMGVLVVVGLLVYWYYWRGFG